jgi:hypothetical protein
LGSAKFDQKCQDNVNVGLRIGNCKSVWDGFDEVKSRVYRRIYIESPLKSITSFPIAECTIKYDYDIIVSQWFFRRH